MRGFNPAILAAFSGTLEVAVVPNNVYGYAVLNQFGDTTAISSTVVANAYGGIPPYTYSWAYVSGSALPTIVNFSANTVCWQLTGSTPGIYSAVWNCTVTDDNGTTVVSENITVDLEISI